MSRNVIFFMVYLIGFFECIFSSQSSLDSFFAESPTSFKLLWEKDYEETYKSLLESVVSVPVWRAIRTSNNKTFDQKWGFNSSVIADCLLQIGDYDDAQSIWNRFVEEHSYILKKDALAVESLLVKRYTMQKE